MPSSGIAQFHQPQFNPHVQEAMRFTSALGLQTSRAGQIAVVGSNDAAKVRERYGLPSSQAGGFNPQTGEVLVIHKHDPSRPKTSRAVLGSRLVHELTHSGSANLAEHYFFREALAGFGEYQYLKWLASHGKFKAGVDFTLQRAGVRLLLPGDMRLLHADESDGVTTAESTQALAAALGVGYGLRASGMKSTDILRASTLNGTRQYEAMKASLSSLQPGLVQQVEAFPQTTEGTIAATAMIQGIAGRRGMV